MESLDRSLGVFFPLKTHLERSDMGPLKKWPKINGFHWGYISPRNTWSLFQPTVLITAFFSLVITAHKIRQSFDIKNFREVGS